MIDTTKLSGEPGQAQTICRVSTEEQATEGYSIAGQAERLKAYAALRELGEVVVIEDAGLSAKNLDRPGLQQILQAVERGHVSNVLIWRLDRLSRDLGDLIMLADKFGKAGVGLYSFTEQLDLTSATGRMQFNILGAFAQFYREQLAENVRMGTAQAVREGKWVNRPKTGYDLIDGELVPNDDAATVRRIFRLRGEGRSYREIADETAVNHSTVMAILKSRIYLGEVQLRDEWFPGRHEPLITEAEFNAAVRGHIPGQRRSRDLLSGRVACGLCGRLAAIQHTPDRRMLYRCHHRGRGCKQPARSAPGLLRAALLGLHLIGQDEQLRTAIREQVRRAGRPTAEPRGPAPTARTLSGLSNKRRKLLELYYADLITAELFAEEERALSAAISAATDEAELRAAATTRHNELSARFEDVAALLNDLDLERMWEAATEAERRVLIEELLERVSFFPDHLEVTVVGAPRLNVRLSEVGLRESRTVGVEGGT